MAQGVRDAIVSQSGETRGRYGECGMKLEEARVPVLSDKMVKRKLTGCIESLDQQRLTMSINWIGELRRMNNRTARLEWL
jgi:hypothetical protein